MALLEDFGRRSCDLIFILKGLPRKMCGEEIVCGTGGPRETM